MLFFRFEGHIPHGIYLKRGHSGLWVKGKIVQCWLPAFNQVRLHFLWEIFDSAEDTLLHALECKLFLFPELLSHVLFLFDQNLMAEQAARVVSVEDFHLHMQITHWTQLLLAFLQLSITKDTLHIDSIILLPALWALYMKFLVFHDKPEHLLAHYTVQCIGWVVIGAHWAYILSQRLHLNHLLRWLIKPAFAFGAWIDVLTDSWIAVGASPGAEAQHFICDTWFSI